MISYLYYYYMEDQIAINKKKNCNLIKVSEVMVMSYITNKLV